MCVYLWSTTVPLKLWFCHTKSYEYGGDIVIGSVDSGALRTRLWFQDGRTPKQRVSMSVMIFLRVRVPIGSPRLTWHMTWTWVDIGPKGAIPPIPIHHVVIHCLEIQALYPHCFGRELITRNICVNTPRIHSNSLLQRQPTRPIVCVAPPRRFKANFLQFGT